MTNQLAKTVATAREALAVAVNKANLSGDPLGVALEAMSLSLGAQGELAQASIDHASMMDERMESAAFSAIQHGSLQLEQRREAIVERLAPELARLTEAIAKSRDRRLNALSLVGAAALALAFGTGLADYAYWEGWGSGHAVALASAGAVSAAIALDGPADDVALVQILRSNSLAAAWARCRKAIVLDRQGRKVCSMPMWADPGEVPGG